MKTTSEAIARSALGVPFHANRSMGARADVHYWPILLQKSLAILENDDSVALTRFAVEAIDDGAAQSRPG